jgi:hypothetical protein
VKRNEGVAATIHPSTRYFQVDSTPKKRCVGVLPKTSRIFGKIGYMSLERKALGSEWKEAKGDGVEQMEMLQVFMDFCSKMPRELELRPSKWSAYSRPARSTSLPVPPRQIVLGL